MKKNENLSKRNWILALPFLIVPLVALLMPEEHYAFGPLILFVEANEKVFPFISGYARLSLFPEVTRLTFSISMTLIAVLLPFFIYYQLQIQDFDKIKLAKGMRNWGWAIGSLAVIPFLMTGPVSGQSIRSLPIDLLICQSRLALGIYGALLTLFEMVFLAFPIIWFKSVFRK